MKRMIAIIWSLTMVFALAACGNQQNQDTASNPDSSKQSSVTTEAPTEEGTETEGTENTESTDGKTLVVYYSATGYTEAVAETIADAAGGDLFELEPVEPYSDADLDWTDRNSRVSVEHDNEDQRDVALNASTVENWDEYDTVFIGYPIWWGIAA